MTIQEKRLRNNLYMREWNMKNPDKVKASRRRKYLKYKDSILAKAKLWRIKNKKHKAQQDRIYNELNKEKVALIHHKYYLKHKQEIVKQASNYKKQRIKIDPIFKLSTVLRTRILVCLIERKYEKSKSTEELLGANIEIVRDHIESLFKVGMNWQNHGTYGWHIDHIVPLDSAKSKDEIYKLFHYKNLQPLWANENLIKGNRVVS